MKKLFLTTCCLLATLALQAEGKSLFITFSDNTRAEFALSSQPEVSFADDQLVVKLDGESSAYELKKVMTFTYGESTGIHKAESNQQFLIEDNKLIVLNANSRVRIFAIDGKDVPVQPVKGASGMVLDLNRLPQGIYIINVNGKTIKVARK